MTKALRSIFLMGFLAALSACGGGGGGGGGGEAEPAVDTGTTSISDTTIQQLAGTWFGTFDDKSTIRTFEFTVSGSDITEMKLNGTVLTGLVGTITKATEAPRSFRFTLTNGGSEVTRGAWFTDPAGNYLTYVDAEFDFGVLQKGTPTALPGYQQTDIDKTWAGDSVSTTSGFSTLTSKRSTATCAATTPATAPASSQCDITITGGTNKIASSVQIDGINRWLGSYADNPDTGTPPAQPTVRAYLSPDKKFAAGWTCPQLGSPFACEFSAWNTP